MSKVVKDAKWWRGEAALYIAGAAFASAAPAAVLPVAIFKGLVLAYTAFKGTNAAIMAFQASSREVVARNASPKQGASQKVRQFQALKCGAYTP